jgi:hypothetical protein
MPNESYLAWLALFAEAIRDQEHLRHVNPSSDDVEVSINAADTARAELIRHFDNAESREVEQQEKIASLKKQNAYLQHQLDHVRQQLANHIDAQTCQRIEEREQGKSAS